jgi:hypothetical protein
LRHSAINLAESTNESTSRQKSLPKNEAAPFNSIAINAEDTDDAKKRPLNVRAFDKLLRAIIKAKIAAKACTPTTLLVLRISSSVENPALISGEIDTSLSKINDISMSTPKTLVFIFKDFSVLVLPMLQLLFVCPVFASLELTCHHPRPLT